VNKLARQETVQRLNDSLRTTFTNGRVMMTNGIQALGEQTVAKVLTAVREFRDFTPDNDPHKEHDFGSVEVEGHKAFWKIDYFDINMEFGSEDPADPKQTVRVLTIMLAEEY
jgi:hypothetical protein